ncbi:MAG: ATP-binding cassette domain-containing protein [bacterium]|nr:ATP-binding cassette domain-containing protein [bacterium]
MASQHKFDRQAYLTMNHIHLSYGSRHALKDISLTLNRAEVHAVIGEHGAGKSSLAHIISGFLKPDSGTMLVKGKSFSSLTPESARKNGIEIVTQHSPLFDNFSIADNIVINHTIGFFPFITRAKTEKKARVFLRKLKFDLDPTILLKSLNLADKALVDILKHLYPGPGLLILDETLGQLSNENRQKVLAVLNTLKAQGLAIMAITHRIDDVYNFADRVTIIRDGEKLTTDSVDNIDKITLIRLAYTHLLAEQQIRDDQHFSQILKYNEAILTTLPINLIVIDKDSRIKLVNESAKALFGFKNTEYKNLRLHEIFPEGNDLILKRLRDAISQKQQMSFYQIPLLAGSSNTVNNLIVYPIFDANVSIGNIIIIEDITRQEKLREQVILSENLASVGLLAAGVAHEINNPLDIMTYYLEHLRFHSNDSTVLDAVRNLDEEINSIAQIVSNLITFSDKKRVTNEIFNVNALIRDLMNLITHNAKKNNISISLDIPPDALHIEANRNEIKQVFLNLVKNSFEAMSDGGTLTISVSGKEHTGMPQIEIIFDDTGAGIEEQKMKEIFLPFYSSKNDSETNIGLGLAISYGIIKKYHGSIIVNNNAHNGCQFTITLPRSL